MEALKRYLDDSKTSQAELAKRVGVTQPTVWEWIHGKSKPSADRLVALADATGMSIDDLLATPPQE
jgi:transcriptional regulator with XRE-family HTH domain